jgi:SAM-dependent methyltransferase
LKDVQKYFDKHSAHHAYAKDPDFYSLLIEHVVQHIGNRTINVLDVGCGNGSFVRKMIQSGVNARFVGMDISKSMIDISHENLKSYPSVDLLVSSGFNIPFREDIKLDIIHVDSVLHHLISRTRLSSTKLAKKMLVVLGGMLKKDGLLIIEEMFYNSYIISSFSSAVIFYGLKFLNALRLDLSKLSDEIALDLEVNFFSEKQLIRLLSTFGNVNIIKKVPAPLSSYKKIFLLKEFGHITYIMTPK